MGPCLLIVRIHDFYFMDGKNDMFVFRERDVQRKGDFVFSSLDCLIARRTFFSRGFELRKRDIIF